MDSSRNYLFIHPENQTLLWNLIQRSKHWNEFSRVLQQRPELWFRNCIEKQYTLICSRPAQRGSEDNTLGLSPREWLFSQNKEVIQRMNIEINTLLYPISVKESPPPPVVAEKMYSTVEESPTLVYSSSRNYDIPPISAFDMEQERKSKYEKAKTDFENYQSQYNRLLQPFAPPAPDFSESVSQPKIANMEELLIIQQKMRETDYDMFSPPPPSPVSSETGTNAGREAVGARITTVEPEGIDRTKIKQEVGKVIDRTILSRVDTLGEPDRKSVSWSPAMF